MRHFSLIICLGGLISLSPLVDAAQVTPGDIEVFIEGKRYISIREYKREKIRSNLSQLLSTKSLSEFSDEEILAIIQEVRKSKNGEAVPSQSSILENPHIPISLEEAPLVEDNAHALNTTQMMEMLDKYQDEHKGMVPIDIKPDKIKSIIIQPKNSSESEPK